MDNIKNWNNFIDEDLIQEDGDGGGGAAGGGDSGGSAGSGDSSVVSGGGGMAYANNGNISGMGEIRNATVSEIPGDPDGSTPGSGDVSFAFPSGVYNKANSGITGKTYPKMSIQKSKKDDIMSTAKQVKDNLGVGKVMSFQSFINM